MAKGKVDVLINMDKGLWEVHLNKKPVKGFRTQDEANKYARDLAKEEGAELGPLDAKKKR